MPDSLLNSKAVAGRGSIQLVRIQANSIPWEPSHRLPVATALVSAILCTAGCSLFPKKQVRVYVPPPVQHPAPPPLKLADGELPALVLEANIDPGIVPPEIVFLPPPAPVTPTRPRPPVAVAPRPVPVTPPAVPEPPPPRIGLTLPPEQLRAYNSELDGILDRDQKALEALARKNLAAEQRDRMAQIRELLTQARQAREQDLVTAVSLARRADTLAKDLLDRLP